MPLRYIMLPFFSICHAYVFAARCYAPCRRAFAMYAALKAPFSPRRFCSRHAAYFLAAFAFFHFFDTGERTYGSFIIIYAYACRRLLDCRLFALVFIDLCRSICHVTSLLFSDDCRFATIFACRRADTPLLFFLIISQRAIDAAPPPCCAIIVFRLSGYCRAMLLCCLLNMPPLTYAAIFSSLIDILMIFPR